MRSETGLLKSSQHSYIDNIHKSHREKVLTVKEYTQKHWQILIKHILEHSKAINLPTYQAGILQSSSQILPNHIITKSNAITQAIKKNHLKVLMGKVTSLRIPLESGAFLCQEHLLKS